MPDTTEQARQAALLAMLDAQIEAHEQGDPDAATEEIEALAQLVRDPKKAAEVIANAGKKGDK